MITPFYFEIMPYVYLFMHSARSKSMHITSVFTSDVSVSLTSIKEADSTQLLDYHWEASSIRHASPWGAKREASASGIGNRLPRKMVKRRTRLNSCVKRIVIVCDTVFK